MSSQSAISYELDCFNLLVKSTYHNITDGMRAILAFSMVFVC